jgi:integrase
MKQQKEDIIRSSISEKPSLERVKDLFLIGCFTGLRFSDFIRIEPENITEEGGAKYIEMLTKETSQRVVIPLKPIVTEILTKYGVGLDSGRI